MDVLIVEDDQEQLDGIESILLEKYDHMNCIKATNYQQATQLMRANKIQLFLLDISLGDDESEQDGIALGTQIRSMQRYAKTPILYLTAYSMDAPRAIHATNCYDFLVKPYKKEDLLYTIDKLDPQSFSGRYAHRTTRCQWYLFSRSSGKDPVYRSGWQEPDDL